MTLRTTMLPRGNSSQAKGLWFVISAVNCLLTTRCSI